MMNVSRSAYYSWLKRPAKVITVEQLNLYRRTKTIFEQTRSSLGYRESRKRLYKKGFRVSDYRVKKLMATLGLVFHSDRGSQYTSKYYRKLVANYGIRASMGDVSAYRDNTVVERFFGSLKHDWLLKVPQPTRVHMRNDVAAYIRYYNLERLHTENGDL